MTEFFGLLASAVALVGCIFLAVATLSLYRMPDIYGRLSATSKAITAGATVVLAGAAIASQDGAVIARSMAGIAFLLLTSPISGYVLARVAWRLGEQALVVYRDPFPKNDSPEGHEPGPPEEHSARS